MKQTDILPAPELGPTQSEPSKWQRERAAFIRLLPTLVPEHRDEFVAIHEENVVATGRDKIQVALEAYRRYGRIPIYVGQVTDRPATPERIPSPRSLANRQGA